jgi:tetratricopeptide (TPR) repeat protein
MNLNPPLGKAFSLEPVELATPGAGEADAVSNESSANSKPKRDLGITTTDEFLAAAADEYEKGRIDPALWRGVADQCDDASLVIAAYLRARATALHQKQDEHLQKQTRRAGPAPGASERKVEPELRLEVVSTKVAGVRLLGVQPKLKYLAAVAAALVSVVVVVWLLGSPWESEPVAQPIVSAARPSLNRSAPPIPLGSEQALVKSTRGGTDPGGQNPALETRVQQLKNDGKWNVLVLYASEWTRKDPNNAAAWYELSVGYANLRQLDEAFDAATKAVELSPGSALFWRNLGHINLAVDRLPEAGIAFDRALAMSSDDVDALCGVALVAQRQGRPKDADAIAKRVKSLEGSCPRVSDGETVVVVVGGSAATKPGLLGGR